jgi:hypothetical protein
MTSQTARLLPWMHACRPADESRKSINANSHRRRPSSTKRALASLGVHPYRVAISLRRFSLAAGSRMLMAVEPMTNPRVHILSSVLRRSVARCVLTLDALQSVPIQQRKARCLKVRDSKTCAGSCRFRIESRRGGVKRGTVDRFPRRGPWPNVSPARQGWVSIPMIPSAVGAAPVSIHVLSGFTQD